VIFAAGSKTPSWELEPDTLGARAAPLEITAILLSNNGTIAQAKDSL
jgi:hypothetical protein